MNKRYEIPSFYINKDFYSMVIFSKQDEKTKLNFRNYNYSNPNRNVPFKLPEEFESKLRSLMTNLDLTSGSIDLIYDGVDFIFLEVNPIGQFVCLFMNCICHIPKHI